MKLKIILAIVTLVAGISSHVNAQNVYYREMQIKPSVSIDGDILYVYTSNSTEHSAKLIYQIIIAVDQKSKSVYISANQAMGKIYRTAFSIDFKRYNIIEPKSYKYYWIDPDRKKNQIDIISEDGARKYGN